MDAELKKVLLEIYTEHEAESWYATANPQLDGYSPKELVECGQQEVVVSCIQRTLDGVYL